MRKTKTEALKTRQYLLHAALEVFYRQGVTRSTLQEIAQQAGVTRGALYWHFKNKEELFEALFEDTFQYILAEELPNESIDDAWVFLRTQLLQLFHNVVHHDVHRKFCNVLNLKCEHTQQNETITALSRKYYDIFTKRIKNLMDLCHQQNRLPKDIDLDLATVYMQGQVMGLMRLWTLDSERFDLLSTAERSIDATLQTLQNSPFLLKSAA